MLRTRIIPTLLISKRGLYKTIKFKNRVYIGDPINTIKIFNDKEVDELLILDIDASRENREPDFDYIQQMGNQCFMPLAYGGGVRTVDHVKRLIANGVEKVVLNSAACGGEKFISAAAQEAGQQSIVLSIDIKRNWRGKYEIRTCGGQKKCVVDIEYYIKTMVDAGAGEVIINSIDRDGAMSGYDLKLIEKVSKIINVPIVACGGAGSLHDFASAMSVGASALSAGSMFVFNGPHRAVLINYPSQDELNHIIYPKNR